MSNYFEEKNSKKAITQLGEQDFGTFFTEKLLLLNSFAQSVGYSQKELPFTDVSAPTKSVVEEYMGFCNNKQSVSRNTLLLHLHQIEIVDNEELIANTEDKIEEISNAELVAMQAATNFVEDLDIEVFGSDEDYENFINGADQMNSVEMHLDMLDAAEASRNADEHHRAHIQNELMRLVLENNGTESTMEAFSR
jgi:hypothetical protein